MRTIPDTVQAVTTSSPPGSLPPSVTRPWQQVEAIRAQSLLEAGHQGRAALAWTWALTGTRPSPITLSLPPGRPPAREEILAEADAEPEGSTAPPGVPTDYCDQLGEARRILTWLTGASDEIPLDDEHRGRFIGARDDYARTDQEICQIRDRAAYDLAAATVAADSPSPRRREVLQMNAAWHCGVRDLLAWVLGDRRSAPLTRRTEHLPTVYDLSNEQIIAEEAIERARQQQPLDGIKAELPLPYCEAVRAAITWLRGETAHPPSEPGSDSLPRRTELPEP